MILLRKGPLRIGEVWFDEKPNTSGVDLLRFMQSSRRPPKGACTDFSTILLDLSKDEPDLLSALKKDARYAVRRAGEQDGLDFNFLPLPSIDQIDAFRDFYDRFAAKKGLSSLGFEALTAYAQAGALALSSVAQLGASGSSSEPMIWHAYLVFSGRARLLHSASLFRDNTDSAYRQMVGRANRYHHWQDISALKAAGVTTYDFGGWYQGTEDQEKLRINKFKEEFGGEIATNYNCELAVTLAGKAYMAARSLLKRGR